jgi:NAD(P)-dependent dehydrogenase (short-subunit alcohol dehydrogenase family)
MSDNYILITGGAKGIGAAIVDRALNEGYKSIVLDILEPQSDKVTDFLKVDLQDVDATKFALNEVCGKYKILRLVNNVGIVKPALIADTNVDDLAQVMMLNTRTTMLCVQACLPAMKDANFGRIVSVTSRVILGKELRTAYSASKGAIHSMSKTWALELASTGITVNSIAPGPINTEAFKLNNPTNTEQTKNLISRIPVNRLGEPEDVAHAVSFFLDKRSGFITGQTLFVCGGMTVGLCEF